MPRGAAPKPRQASSEASHRKPKADIQAIATTQQAELARYAPPEDLSPAASDVWRMAVAQMHSTGTLREFGTVHVRFFCDQFVTYLEAQAHIDQYGTLVDSDRGPVPNPEIRTRDNALDRMLKLSDRLGLDPLSMLKLGIIQVAGQSMLAGLHHDLGLTVKT